MSQENVEVGGQHRDLLDQLQARLPGLSGVLLAGLGRTHPGSNLRKRMLSWTVKRGFRAMNRSDVDLVVMSYEPDADIRMSGMGGVGIRERYMGHQGIRELYADLDEAFSDWAFRVQEVIDLPDRMAVRADFLGHGGSSGAEITLVDVGTLFTVSVRGKVARQDWFVESGGWHATLEAARLEE
jgi:ketosteroid isomerase-like protein